MLRVKGRVPGALRGWSWANKESARNEVREGPPGAEQGALPGACLSLWVRCGPAVFWAQDRYEQNIPVAALLSTDWKRGGEVKMGGQRILEKFKGDTVGSGGGEKWSGFGYVSNIGWVYHHARRLDTAASVWINL